MSHLSDIAVLDLRDYTAAAAREIKSISDVAVLILPKDADEELAGLLAAIPKEDIAMTLSLSKKGELHMYNGMVFLNDANIGQNPESLIVANGLVVIQPLSAETRGSLAVNGKIIFHESLRTHCPVSVVSCNGAQLYVDFNDIKVYSRDITVDDEFISYLKPKTTVIAGRDIYVKASLETLKEREILFIPGRDIICPKELMSYLAATSQCGREIVDISIITESENRKRER